MSRDTGMFLQDILEAIQAIQIYTEGISIDQLMQDKKTRDAIIHNFAVIEIKHSLSELKNKLEEIIHKDNIFD